MSLRGGWGLNITTANVCNPNHCPLLPTTATTTGRMKRIIDGRPNLGKFTLTCKGCEQELPVGKVTPCLQSWDNVLNTFKKTVLFRFPCNKCAKLATYSFPLLQEGEGAGACAGVAVVAIHSGGFCNGSCDRRWLASRVRCQTYTEITGAYTACTLLD